MLIKKKPIEEKCLGKYMHFSRGCGLRSTFLFSVSFIFLVLSRQSHLCFLPREAEAPLYIERGGGGGEIKGDERTRQKRRTQSSTLQSHSLYSTSSKKEFAFFFFLLFLLLRLCSLLALSNLLHFAVNRDTRLMIRVIFI